MNTSIAVVGAGIAGCAVSLLLADRGHTVHLFEKRDDVVRAGGRSINLALSVRGLRTLAEVGVLDRLRPLAVPMRGRLVHRRDAAEFQPYDLVGTQAIYSFRRAALLDALLTQLASHDGIRVHYGFRCTGVEGDGRTVCFEANDGRVHRHLADAVVGADGARSVVRDAVLARSGSAPASLVSTCEYREVPIDAASAREHGLTAEVLHIWPGMRGPAVALPNRDGTLTATLFDASLPPGGSLAAEDCADHSAFRLNLEEQAREIRSPLGQVLQLRCEHWHDGDRILILGDAAHPIAPFFGQGANAALEDCLILATLLDDAGQHFAHAFATFARIRKPGADTIADLSVHNFSEMRDGVAPSGGLDAREVERTLQLRHPSRFVPLYALVSFSRMPYEEARARALEQGRIVRRLMETPGPLDLDAADSLVHLNLRPLSASVREALSTTLL